MSSPFAIHWEWLSPFANSAEGCTFADVEILVTGCVATELEDFQSQTLRKGMYVSAWPLAMFFAANWWRLRWEPLFSGDVSQWRMHHNLAAAGEGYAWPDLTFASDGEFILVTSRPTIRTNTAPVRYLADFARWIPADVFEHIVSQCIEGVLARLGAMGVEGGDLADLWKEVRLEQTDAQTALWRRLEALAGYDPDEAPQGFVTDLLDASESAGPSVIQELTAASREQVLNDLKILQEGLRTNGLDFCIADFERIAADTRVSASDPSVRPWQRGTNIARIVRSIWGLDGKPVSNRLLADLCGFMPEVLESHAGPGSMPGAPYSATSWDQNKNARRLILNRKPVTSRRFAVCRLLGDILVPNCDWISAATEATTSRQKFQRAFAQELLCPFESLMDFLNSDAPGEDDIEDAADFFQVSPRLVYATLVNHRILPREPFEMLW